jgi:predicted nucleotide-binding protein (sugar kinase/HSP70/actin superfamily)
MNSIEVNQAITCLSLFDENLNMWYKYTHIPAPIKEIIDRDYDKSIILAKIRNEKMAGEFRVVSSEVFHMALFEARKNLIQQKASCKTKPRNTNEKGGNSSNT